MNQAQSQSGQEQQLAIRPLRNQTATLERKPAGGALVRIEAPGHWPMRSRRVTRTFELDEMGLLVWGCCDGQTSLLAIVEQVAAHNQIDFAAARTATLKFLDALAHRRLMGIAPPDAP